MDLNLEDFIDKCRCCFRQIIDEKNVLNINKNIEENYFNLTSIKVCNNQIKNIDRNLIFYVFA